MPPQDALHQITDDGHCDGRVDSMHQRRIRSCGCASRSSVRVLHGPVNVGNQPYVLSRHERELGADSSLVVNYSTWLAYPADRVLGDYGSSSARARLRRLAFGLSAPFRFDVLHFYFGRSFLTWDDL